MDIVREAFARDMFARHNNVELVEYGPGRAVARMTITDNHLNGMKMVHGAAMATLADFTFAVAVNSDPSAAAVAINMEMTLVKAARAGTLTATAKVVSQNKKLASCTVHITDESGDLLVVFQGLAFRKSVDLATSIGLEGVEHQPEP